MTFSLSPTSRSVLPAKAASVSTLVVSWKLAAEMKLALWTAALVMPKSCVLARSFPLLDGVEEDGANGGPATKTPTTSSALEALLGEDHASGE